MANSKWPKIILTLYFLISSLSHIIANAQLTYIHQSCYSAFGRYNFLSDYHNNIEGAITALASKASTTYYNTHTIGSGDDTVNALFSCRYDITPQVCQSCVASTANNISWCLGNVESLIAYEECTLHYSNRTIFSVMEDLPQLYEFSTNSEDNEVRYNQFLENLITDLIIDVVSEFAVSSRYFGTTTSRYSSSESIYALAQCNPDITSLECRTCLQTGFDDFATNYTSRVYGQIFLPSCRLSYILTSDEPSRPWRFSETFDPNRSPSTIPGITDPSKGTRASAKIGPMIAIIFVVGHSMKHLL